MWAIASKLVPFRDYVYAAVIVAAVIFYNVHVHNLEVAYSVQRVAAVEQADRDATDRTLRAAKDAMDAKEKQYADNLKQISESYAKQLQTDDAQHAFDLNRLRQLASAGHSDGGSVLPGPGSSSSSSDSGRSGLIGLGYVSAELAAALHDARDDLAQCYAERDSLTGKP